MSVDPAAIERVLRALESQVGKYSGADSWALSHLKSGDVVYRLVHAGEGPGKYFIPESEMKNFLMRNLDGTPVFDAESLAKAFELAPRNGTLKGILQKYVVTQDMDVLTGYALHNRLWGKGEGHQIFTDHPEWLMYTGEEIRAFGCNENGVVPLSEGYEEEKRLKIDAFRQLLTGHPKDPKADEALKADEGLGYKGHSNGLVDDMIDHIMLEEGLIEEIPDDSQLLLSPADSQLLLSPADPQLLLPPAEEETVEIEVEVVIEEDDDDEEILKLNAEIEAEEEKMEKELEEEVAKTEKELELPPPKEEPEEDDGMSE